MGKDEVKKEEPVEDKPDRSRLSKDDKEFLAKMDGITTEITANIVAAFESVAKFNEKFKARKIPKQKIPTMVNSIERMGAVFGEDHPHIIGLRKDLAASELATNEVGDMFDLEKRLQKCKDILEK